MLGDIPQAAGATDDPVMWLGLANTHKLRGNNEESDEALTAALRQIKSCNCLADRYYVAHVLPETSQRLGRKEQVREALEGHVLAGLLDEFDDTVHSN